jgi:mono/diheme cytochrome c family protein
LQIIAKDGPKRYAPPNSSQGANPKSDGEIHGMRHISNSLVVCGLLFSAFLLNMFAAQDLKSAQQTATASLAAPREFYAEPSAQRLARGKYLVEGTAQCFQCHSQPDFEKGFGQPMPGTEGAGQFIDREEIDHELYPGGIVCPNITPDKETGAGTWTDAQFEQAIRHGIGHDGRNLIRFMPYSFFRSMTDEDVASVIVYLRSIPAVKNVLPKMKLGFEVKTDMRPEMELLLAPDATDQVRHGWYLVRIAHCNACHTPHDEAGNAQTDQMFGGGRRFQGPWGDVVSANITCHPSGISHYDAAMFINTIRTGRASAGVRDLSTIMPYSYFRKMSDEDLTAIFAYLHSVKPVFHEVDNSEPPTFCKICKQKHGLGERN